MKDDLPIKNGIVIPAHELEVTTSRAGGPGGQHVNKTDSRITVRWNVKNSSVLTDEQKDRVLSKLACQLTSDGDLIIHSSASRSQQQNKQAAFIRLAEEVRRALVVPKKRMATRISQSAKKARLDSKTRHGIVKKMRSKNIHDD